MEETTRNRAARILDIGCGAGDAWLRKAVDYETELLCGVEGHPGLAKKAGQNGFTVYNFDLNGRWLPLEDDTFEALHCGQVIEHLHNTRLFLSEAFRVLKPGGRLCMTSENLCSLLNTCAMLLGYTPFSLINACGWYVGNPYGLWAGQDQEEVAGYKMPALDDPAFSGVSGHVRVLSVPQAAALLEKIGFVNIKVSSIGFMPLPRLLEPLLAKWMWRRGHWLKMYAEKPRA